MQIIGKKIASNVIPLLGSLVLLCENVFRAFSSKPNSPHLCKRTSCDIHEQSCKKCVGHGDHRFHWETGRFTLQTACLNLAQDSQSHSKMSDSPTVAENNEKQQQGSAHDIKAHYTLACFFYGAVLCSLKGSGWVSYSCGCFSPMISSSCFGTPSLFTPGTWDSWNANIFANQTKAYPVSIPRSNLPFSAAKCRQYRLMQCQQWPDSGKCNSI